MKKRFLSMFALLLMAATGAWAQEETLLTTITATGTNTYSETTPGVVTVTHDNDNFFGEYGWLWYFHAGSITVEAKEGYTITKCVFRQADKSATVTISTAPFKVNFVETHPNEFDPEYVKYLCEGTNPGDDIDGFSTIEVYGPATPVTGITLDKTEASMTVGGDALTLTPTVAPNDATDKTVTWTTSDATVATVTDGVVTAVAAGTATITATATNGTDDTSDDKTATCTVTVAGPTYAVTLKEGTEDAGNWSVPTEAAEGSPVTVTYSGEKKVKSVKAVKKAAPAPAPVTVTINLSDWGERGQRSFTKDGVTVSADMIDPEWGELGGDITFSTTLGIFTKIVVTAENCRAEGTGWSGDESTMTWAGTPASTVSFRGEVVGRGSNPTTIVCTIVPTN